MSMQRTVSIIAAILLVTSLAPAALAQTNTLGIGPNDVRDEPNHDDDANGIPHREFSPGNNDDPTDQLILESYTQVDAQVAGEDLNNILNRALNGNNYESYEYYLYPGQTDFQAYFGWWTADTGSGGGLQEDQVKADDNLGIDGVPDVNLEGEPNGAIDDALDNDTAAEWDEFVWRGNNEYAVDHGFCDENTDGQLDDDCKNEEMYVFMQPGTHNIHVNCVFDPRGVLYVAVDGCALDSASDSGSVPDFTMEDRTNIEEYGSQTWIAENGFGRVTYDASLLIGTTVTTSVNPTSTGSGSGENVFDPASGDLVDVDGYSTVNPLVEQLYRTAVWNPGGSDEGAKECLKDCVSMEDIPSADDVTEPVEPTAGLAKAQLSPIHEHEPNTQFDDFNGHATHDPATSYGGDPYYAPGEDQDYTGYQEGEQLWLDGQAMYDGCPLYLVAVYCYGANYYAPGGQVASDTGSNNAAPGGLYLHANVGSWWDSNGDTWVGDVSNANSHVGAPGDVHAEIPSVFRADAPDDPYASGMDEDPNQYTSDEFRGACAASNVEATLVPMTPNQQWGDTGVYVHDQTWDPYSPMVADATGGFQFEGPGGANVYLNDTDTYGDGGTLSRYVTEGPITITGGTVGCSSTDAGTGDWEAGQIVVFPAGNLDYEVRIDFTATITEDWPVRDDAPNSGGDLSGDSVLDVDFLEPAQPSV